MNLNLSNKTALVCGSNQGIGFASAKALANLGANIVLCARNENKLREALTQIPCTKDQRHSYIVCDFSKPETIDKEVSKLLKTNPIHILINNTGGPPAGEISSAKEIEFLNAFNSHLICNHKLALLTLESMKKEGYGRIINIISTSVKAPLKGLGVSNTIRGAVANWAKTLANEVGKHQITVNNVLPGATGTERLTSIIENKSKKLNVEETKVADQMKSQIPLARFAEPEEIANAVAFLASPAASYITGINVPVDGGRTVCL